MSIRTRNLELIPNEPRHLLALYSGAESYQQLWLIRWIRLTPSVPGNCRKGAKAAFENVFRGAIR